MEYLKILSKIAGYFEIIRHLICHRLIFRNMIGMKNLKSSLPGL